MDEVCCTIGEANRHNSYKLRGKLRNDLTKEEQQRGSNFDNYLLSPVFLYTLKLQKGNIQCIPLPAAVLPGGVGTLVRRWQQGSVPLRCCLRESGSPWKAAAACSTPAAACWWTGGANLFLPKRPLCPEVSGFNWLVHTFSSRLWLVTLAPHPAPTLWFMVSTGLEVF